MTTEDDFNAMLDAEPYDCHTRLVFADWLQERGDPRAEGYRALGLIQVKTDHFREYQHGYHKYFHAASKSLQRCSLPDDWWDRLESFARISPLIHERTQDILVAMRLRREAEDAAALAFAKLSAERRAELLATVPA